MSALQKLSRLTEYEHTTCAACGVSFYLPDYFVANKRRTKETFYCPSGHSLVFNGRNKEDILREELEQKELAIKRKNEELARKNELLESVRRQRDRAERSSASYKGKLGSVKRRAAHGVCPCCSRTFKQLAAHMKTKHPEYIQTQQDDKAK